MESVRKTNKQEGIFVVTELKQEYLNLFTTSLTFTTRITVAGLSVMSEFM